LKTFLVPRSLKTTRNNRSSPQNGPIQKIINNNEIVHNSKSKPKKFSFLCNFKIYLFLGTLIFHISNGAWGILPVLRPKILGYRIQNRSNWLLPIHGLTKYQSKMSSSKKIHYWGDFEAVVYLSEALSHVGFCLRWSNNCVGSEFGQIQSVKLQNMVSITGINPNPPPTPLSNTLTVYTVLRHRERGRVEPERRLEGQLFTKLGRKYQHDWLYLQSDKPLLQSPFTGRLF
jgi:hypothetical protein